MKYTQEDCQNLEEFAETERLERKRMQELECYYKAMKMQTLDYVIIGLIVAMFVVVGLSK